VIKLRDIGDEGGIAGSARPVSSPFSSVVTVDGVFASTFEILISGAGLPPVLPETGIGWVRGDRDNDPNSGGISRRQGLGAANARDNILAASRKRGI